MQQKNIQQEVLVLTQTSSAQKALIGHNGGDEKPSPAEELERVSGMARCMKCSRNSCSLCRAGGQNFLSGS